MIGDPVTIKGDVRIRLTRLAGNNAVVMGLFFSPAAAQLAKPGAGSLSVGRESLSQSSGFHMRISGQVGQRLIVQSSDDLVHWTGIREVVLQSSTQEFVDPSVATAARLFYRALPVTTD